MDPSGSTHGSAAIQAVLDAVSPRAASSISTAATSSTPVWLQRTAPFFEGPGTKEMSRGDLTGTIWGGQ